jgi:hypothetical protein
MRSTNFTQLRNVAEYELLYSNEARLQEVRYSDIKSDYKTGDIILVDGRYDYSFALDLLQGNRWGHSAMVVRAKDVDPTGALHLPQGF